MIEEARARITRGDLGAVRLANVEYSQAWLSRAIDAAGDKQAKWRPAPARAGMGGCLGDIGTHTFHLAEHVTGLKVAEFCADLTTHVPGRRLDDDVNVLLRFDGGARGVLKATQVAAGDENGLRLRVHGELGGLEWSQMEPDTLTIRWFDRPAEMLRAGGPGLEAATSAMQRIPAGHQEGYIEAFGNLYRAFAAAIQGEVASAISPAPGVADGLRTMAFVEAVIANTSGNAKWTGLEEVS